MKKVTIKDVEDAIRLFEDNAIARGTALDNDDYKTYNKLYPVIPQCIAYLYEQDKLQLLHHLLKHENFHVRYEAAYALLPVFSSECEIVLSEIAQGKDYGMEGFNAEQTLKMWKSGELHYPYQPECLENSSKEADQEFKGAFLKREDDIALAKEENETVPANLSLRISKWFNHHLEGNQEEVADVIGVYIGYNTDTHELVFRINTFVNPYTQDVESVYLKRVERFKAFEYIATVSADKPSKYGFMQILLTIHEDNATDDLLQRIKDTIDWNNREWKPNECKVCCKVEYRGAECYFEGSWWYVLRAVIKNRKGYERYDFSDESKFDEEMWDLESGEYDSFEYKESFELISPSEFQNIWDRTIRVHVAKPL
ncbi:MAG: DUF2019 domain-containing protein [Prevotella sp.]|nr:DUF2019 domain-containing protein [Lachnospiraceae bacterium]MBR1400791.1 DUF2019 domain-containing protein [Prevotella sp.]